MRRLGCILSAALLLRLASSSFLKGHFESASVAAARDDPGSSVDAARDNPRANKTHGHPILQLMSLSLDDWGSMHDETNSVAEAIGTHSRTLGKLPDLALFESSPLPLLSLLSLNLENWGSREATSQSSLEQTPDKVESLRSEHVHPLEHVAKQVHSSVSTLFYLRGLLKARAMSFFMASHGWDPLVEIGLFVLILVLLALIVSHCCWNSSEYDDQPRSPTQEADFATAEFGDGSWAQVYREAQGEQKEALELLFRCNIISTDEFAFSSVSPEHIQECIWIATHMLRQKPLEEWVALWQQAQQTFEDSVAACFEARGGPYSSTSENLSSPRHLNPPLPNLSLGAVPLSGRSNRLSSSVGEEDEEEDPYTTRSHYTRSPIQGPVGDDLRESDPSKANNATCTST